MTAILPTTDSGPTGLVVVNKPAGWTSHDVVARLRKLLGTRKVGHAGTLDPMATGVLVVGVGKGTRLLTYLVGLNKTYTATIRLGQATNTDDADGQVTFTAPPDAVRQLVDQSGDDALGVAVDGGGDNCGADNGGAGKAAVAGADGQVAFTASPDAVRGLMDRPGASAAIGSAVADLTGPIMQVPSTVSAIKVKGQRAYVRARAGETVELAARPVVVHRFDVLASHPINLSAAEVGRGKESRAAGGLVGLPGAGELVDKRNEKQGSMPEAALTPTAVLDLDVAANADHKEESQETSQLACIYGVNDPVDERSEDRGSGLEVVPPPAVVLDLDVVVEVSSGTYVRALARDLGKALGVGGHLTALCRTAVGPFTLDEATLPLAKGAAWSMAEVGRGEESRAASGLVGLSGAEEPVDENSEDHGPSLDSTREASGQGRPFETLPCGDPQGPTNSTSMADRATRPPSGGAALIQTVPARHPTQLLDCPASHHHPGKQPLSSCAQLPDPQKAAPVLMPLAEAATRLFPVRRLTTGQATDLAHGRFIEVSPGLVGSKQRPVAGIGPDGQVVALLADANGKTRPLAVFA